MSLVTVELDTPTTLNHRWASLGATWAALGWGDDTYARGPVRHYYDGGGNWARMVLLAQGRAVLFGNDHEYSETYWAEAAAYFEKPETDLLAGAPSWWGDAVTEYRDGGDDDWIGFVYGWEDGRWQRAAYDRTDGFTALGLPAVSHINTIEVVEVYLSRDSERQIDQAAVEAMVQAGPEVTENQLRAVLAPDQDVSAALAAAASCRLPS